MHRHKRRERALLCHFGAKNWKETWFIIYWGQHHHPLLLLLSGYSLAGWLSLVKTTGEPHNSLKGTFFSVRHLRIVLCSQRPPQEEVCFPPPPPPLCLLLGSGARQQAWGKVSFRFLSQQEGGSSGIGTAPLEAAVDYADDVRILVRLLFQLLLQERSYLVHFVWCIVSFYQESLSVWLFLLLLLITLVAANSNASAASAPAAVQSCATASCCRWRRRRRRRRRRGKKVVENNMRRNTHLIALAWNYLLHSSPIPLPAFYWPTDSVSESVIGWVVEWKGVSIAVVVG